MQAAMSRLLDPDRNMIQRAREGDELAFTWLVETYQTALYNLCYRMLGDADQAEEAAQETFLRVYAQLRSFDVTRSFKTWLFSIAHHYCIDRLRRRRLTWLSIESEQMDEHPALRSPAPTPEQVALQHETRLWLQSALNQLAPEYRSVVLMRYWYDLSYEEIAEATSTSVSAVKSRLHRARETLACKIEVALRGHVDKTTTRHVSMVI
jgi:RNA polymerase sigma-70 factor (ECF subfamily)